ncbi:hypothetical protein OG205_16710 [Lentzea sp. NBC_00516]|uniref:hypothetical protein n=1 Tax=Lentzea sp. NBC_00516 TaxID=2903582 RepID=UPI002E7FFCD1|nr:hypothetical protein [Lentzea sp. NBC_00516]WUD28577.1 hypothetical protein OG205_16710 [Lentzea sp. NBC_00516]
MDSKMAWLASAVTAVVVSAGAVLVTAGPAAAAPPACKANSWYKACVAVWYETSHVKSIRVDGRCLYGAGYHPTVIVDNVSGVYPKLLTYGGSKCESNTHNSAGVRWAQNADKDQYRWVNIS